ncbi:MAG TPA: DUF2867 domain-containing protein [Anaerolineales bacterium]|nr:DUF2867 domain-containing protein [Anaerolineales bacterium]
MAERVLVTGATGYVGGRLVPRLLEAGYRVRVLVRDPSHLQGRAWLDRVEVVQGDVLEPETMEGALRDVKAAYYLIHSMRAEVDFRERDQLAARNFAQLAEKSGLQRIIYLGGLGDPNKKLSEHLRSRHEVGRILTMSGIPVIEFRSAVIVGSGSASFEMMRYVVEGLPILICPPWVITRIQPISIRDVLDYFIAALKLPGERLPAYQVIEIGGSEVLTYHDMMRGYAAARGLKRWMIRMPWLPTRLCAYWLQWITPIPAGIAYVLIESIRNEVIVRNDSASQLFPQIRPRNYQVSLERALMRISSDQVETTWSDSQASYTGDIRPVTLTTYEGLLLERRQRFTAAPPEAVYRVFTGLGGKRGWLHANWIWLARGIIDRMVGGPGFRRGRRHPDELRVGDAVDFWRVEMLQPGRQMRLRAEMKVPGLAWLQFEVTPYSSSENLVTQTAFFEPKGLPGLLYWYLLYPIHGWMFSMLIRRVVEKAERTR